MIFFPIRANIVEIDDNRGEVEEAQDDLTGNLDERLDDNGGEEVYVDVDENIEEFNEQTTCNLCGRIFTSQYHLERHDGSNMCKTKG